MACSEFNCACGMLTIDNKSWLCCPRCGRHGKRHFDEDKREHDDSWWDKQPCEEVEGEDGV